MEDYKMINGVMYQKSKQQPKNKLQALVTTPIYWEQSIVTQNMCTGRSTGFILKLLGEAMIHYNTRLDITQKLLDDVGSKIVLQHTLDEIEQMIEKTGLKFFELDKYRKTLTYNILL